jgi:hypothetical protein
MYPSLVLLHVLSTFGFLFAHGASAAVMFRLRVERHPARICALLDLSSAVGRAMAITALSLFGTGLVLGFMGGWWRRGWIWASFALFLGISIVMSWQGRLYFERLRAALGGPGGGAGSQPGEPVAHSDLPALLAAGRPKMLAAVGLGGLAIITWLMMLKPF